MLNEHEQRRTVVGEMHLRRWPLVHAPAAIIQFVRVLAPGEREAERAAMAALPQGAQLESGDNPRHLEGCFAPGLAFTWERHSEASTTSLFMDNGDVSVLFGPRGDAGLQTALEWACALPGKVIRATRLLLVADETEAAGLLPDMGFAEEELVSCYINSGGQGDAAARIWSDFRLRADGFGVMLVAANGMSSGDLTRTLQRLQELGNYRNLALLGLPVARDGWKVLDHVEAALGAMNQAVVRPEVTDDELLEEVSRLSMELVSQATASDYRMSATEAYATIVEERLADLHIRPCPGFLSLADFTQRRFLPAIRTCAAHRRRADQLAQRTAQFVSLFRTRIETRIENQNGRLLASMERSASRQLRLQQLVEGLSVVAVSYYALGLLAKVLEGIESLVPGMDVHAVTALMVPVVVVTVWFGLHHMKGRILGPMRDGPS
ncbi:DUF3422 domain-containing protein [Novosphingobium mangrovi (ex Huang et al. 2023)]|uniref:DUF3422 domain-containing protein n=1 Tax=Novosphingobium mangrovi (ex Huang et al. 2023) TaxID=2976432 RepID=A0ABT2I1S3_9SPHN|nr:DUF3422 domain-containing protein [Novosphingobium mangrovi (ex Huang et al. 2023)]MCT2398754.1 DUF3422 domain-containing protein [Novosphingobium mangrovi (ex Huang et al. 2023)]